MGKKGHPPEQSQSSDKAMYEQQTTGQSGTIDYATQVKLFLANNRKYFAPYQLPDVERMLYSLSPEQWIAVSGIDFKDPTIMLIISILVGEMGVDRFLLRDTKNGIFKLLLTLCCGIGLVWWLIDLFKIREMTQQYNIDELREVAAFMR